MTARAQVTVTFDVTRDVDLASVDVQNRVNQALGRLPNEVKNTGVIITKQLGGFVFGAGVYSPDGAYDSLVSQQLSGHLRARCGEARSGRRRRAHFWRTQIRHALVARSGTHGAAGIVRHAMCSRRLQEQNVQVAAGQVGQAPLPAGQSFQISVRAIGRLTEPSEFENIILKTGTNGTLVRLKDVGRAELGAEDYGSILTFDGHEAVGIGVTQLPGANALDVDRLAKAELLRLSKTFPPGLKYAVAFDTTTVIGESITRCADHACCKRLGWWSSLSSFFCRIGAARLFRRSPFRFRWSGHLSS